jgi:hypothetical protein
MKQEEHYWSIAIEANFIQAAIWTIEDSITKVVATGSVTRWETEEDLVTAADTSLSSAVANLEDPNVEPSKCVFGVPPSWVQSGQIAREHLDKIRQICNKLSLEPTGFVVLSEAIAHFIKSDEGAPLNGVVIGVGATQIDVSVFRLGNLSGSVEVGRSVSVADDVVEALVRFQTGDPLPSRFLLYSGKSGELEDVRQNLITADWLGELKEKLTFLHTPQVEIIDADRKIIAVSLAGASEIAQVTGVEVPKPVEEQQLQQIHNQVSAPEAEEVVPEEELEGPTPEDVGFTINEELESRLPDETDNNLTEAQPLYHAPPAPKVIVPPFIFASKKKVMDLFSKLKSTRLPRKQHSIPVATPPHSEIHTAHMHKVPPIHTTMPPTKRPLLLGGIVFGVLLVGGFLAWWMLPKAEITIFIAPRTLEKNIDVQVDSSLTTADIEKRTIPGQERTITVNGDKTTSTSGRKTVGEKAKGSVQIRNGTSVGIKVNAGTALFGPNDLKFTTDASASVSAAESPSNPGSGNVNVVAESIGAEYNLAQGETFKVGNYPKSEVDAVVAENLSGGSSREITAVSSEDQKSLEASLLQELTDQGKSQFVSGLSEDEVFIPDSLTTVVGSKSFSNKVGDEASSLRLSLQVEVKGLIIRRSDLNSLAVAILQEQVPGGFVLREDQVEVDFNAVNGGKTFDTSFQANLLPEVDPDEVKNKIAGKYPTIAQDYLATIPGFVRAQIKVNPLFPGGLGTLPRVVGNIDIIISAEQ